MNILNEVERGFLELDIKKSYVSKALFFLKKWLSEDEFKNYVPQIEHLIKNKHWNYLLDSFYQVIPFGTGGRRGEVGVGPNRINPWTIRSSAQGHSQYLLKKHGEKAKRQGVVFAYDVRIFLGNRYLDNKIHDPLSNLTSKDLAIYAGEVYAANGFKVFIFDDVRTTPELSFAIRYLKAVAGDMFSASHNPPDHNGKKVYDKFGGQLIPPVDEELVDEVTKKVKKIKSMPFEEAVNKGLIKKIGKEIDEEYLKEATAVSLSRERGLKIVYTPLHGCGMSSVFEALKREGFDVVSDEKTSNPSGRFENITFNIANPEVVQSFDTALEFARKNKADIILSTDPDADRIGIMVKHNGRWVFMNGNEIAVILSDYVIRKKKKSFRGDEIILKTTVTTNLIKTICERNGVEVCGELMIGFKYIADIMNKLENEGKIESFLLGSEESHGYIAGNYARDKDAVVPAIWLAELSAEMKKKSKTLVDVIDDIYKKYGYYKNYLTEIRLLSATGKGKIEKIQNTLRKNPPSSFGDFKVSKFEDCFNRKPILSETDKLSKDVLIFEFEPIEGLLSIKVTVRPSGTEPKIKMYFEIGFKRVSSDEGLKKIKRQADVYLRKLEKVFMLECYKIIGVDFPERGFLLFWQLPLDVKMKYFKIESKIEKLKQIKEKEKRKQELMKLVEFLGSNPIEKIDDAFKKKNRVGIKKYLSLS